MFLGQDVFIEFDQVDSVVSFDDFEEKFPIREQKDRSIIDLGEATFEDDYSEDSFPHSF